MMYGKGVRKLKRGSSFGYTTYFFQLANMDDPFLGNIIVQMILVVGIITGKSWPCQRLRTLF